MSTRGEDTRRRLLDATGRVVRQVGYAHATTKAIAEAAGVAEGTIYRHFPDKRQLFVAAVLARNAPVADSLARLPEAAGSRTVRENLAGALRQLALLRAEVVPLELVLQADPELSRSLQDVLAALPLAGGPPAQLAQYLRAEQSIGRVRPEHDADELAVVLLAALFGLGAQPGSDEDVEHLVGVLVDVVVTGVAPTPNVVSGGNEVG